VKLKFVLFRRKRYNCTVKKNLLRSWIFSQNSFVYMRKCIQIVNKLLINVYFVQIRYFFIKNLLWKQILSAFIIYKSKSKINLSTLTYNRTLDHLRGKIKGKLILFALHWLDYYLCNVCARIFSCRNLSQFNLQRAP